MWRCFILTLIFFLSPDVFSQDEITVRFEILPPQHFRSVSEMFVSGGDAALKSWDGKGIRLVPDGNVFAAAVKIPRGKHIEYKATLGDWQHVETDGAGNEIGNRSMRCDGDCTIRFEVANFRVHQFHPVPKTATDRIRYHFDFYFEPMKNYRNVAVYLPPGYEHEPSRNYPVLYAFDGNNLFDTVTATMGAEWGIDKTLNDLITQGKIPPVIVVGIYCTSYRAEEYLPREWFGPGRHGEQYAKFMFNDIKPFIDEHYRTLKDRDNTLVMGSSNGGNLTLHTMLHHSDKASRFIAMSPAIAWTGDWVNGRVKKAKHKPARLWVDEGDREWQFTGDEPASFVAAAAAGGLCPSAFEPVGKPVPGVAAYRVKGGVHHESSWGGRFATALEFALGLK